MSKQLTSRQLRTTAVLLALALAAHSASAQRLSGIVRDSSAHVPLAGAVVTVLDSAHASLANAISDEAGRYSVALGARAAQVRVVHIGYQPLEQPVPRGTGCSRGW